MADDRDTPQRWQKREHNAVFEALDRALGRMQFPASLGRMAREAGGEPVSDESTLPLLKYIEALPERMYESPKDVKRELDACWSDLRSFRGVGYEREPQASGGSAP